MQQSPIIWSYAWGNLGQGNHGVSWRQGCSKSSVCKTLFVHIKTQSQHFRVFWGVKSVFGKLRFQSWRISVDGRLNCRKKAPFSWRISLDGRPNRRKKAPFSWRINVDGRPDRRKKAPFSWRISVDARSNRRKKAAFSHFSGVVRTVPQFLGVRTTLRYKRLDLRRSCTLCLRRRHLSLA